ncbi:hypothetical protein HBN85_11980 [Pseudomonas fragi]|uniref:ABC-three component system middle component 1 n=1 Tax=Pseudomonas fragi TaxID=296 RepID=UPI0014727458|nr:ABC-three component system middle component 1 [Pseudomonas fragi]NNA85477.1 hypothetical protein [Pseudomonas fragi]NNB38677.1 hypothetical protein [Pseudomonas fragi]
MLINLIDKVFLSNGYESVEFDHGYDKLSARLYKPSDTENKAEFYLLVESEEASSERADQLLSKWADELYSILRQNPAVDRVFAKNCTMIICWPEIAITSRQIFQIEEDRYNFKKNVISYSAAELTDLLVKDIDFTLAQINDLIGAGDGRYFQQFKAKSAELENYYSLLLKIFIKIPFVTYVHDPKRLFDLDSSLVSRLSVDERALYDFTLNLDDDLSDQELMMQFLGRIR